MAGKYKTMTLIEEAELERLRQRQIKEYNPNLKSLANVQAQIEKLLEDPELDDEGKSKVLHHLQEKFGYLYNRFKNSGAALNPINVANPQPEEVEDAPGENREVEDDEDESPTTQSIVSASSSSASTFPTGSSSSVDSGIFPNGVKSKIPQIYQKKYSDLINFLELHKDKISANPQNELILDGVPILGSSMPDLLRSLFVRNSKMNLNGLSEFHRLLRQLNANPNLFSHKDTVNVMKAHITPFRKSHPISCPSSSQKGTGSKLKALFPPGKKPRFLHVFRK